MKQFGVSCRLVGLWLLLLSGCDSNVSTDRPPDGNAPSQHPSEFISPTDKFLKAHRLTCTNSFAPLAMADHFLSGTTSQIDPVFERWLNFKLLLPDPLSDQHTCA